MRTRRFGGYRRLTTFAILVIAAVAFQQVAYGNSGSLDKTFHTDGKVQTNIAGFDVAWGIAIDTTGRIIAVGQAAASDSADFAVVRYLPNGNLDTSFGSSGKVTVDFGFQDVARGVALDAQGRIIVVGTSDEGDDLDWILTRLTPSGALDLTFGADHTGKIRTGFGGDLDEANAVAIDALNRIVVVGRELDEIADDSDFGLIRFNSDGTLDSTFDSDGLLTIGFGTFEEAHAVAIDATGRIVVAGRSGAPGRFAVARVNDNGTLDGTFDGDGRAVTPFNAHSTARTVAIDGLGRIVLGGFATDPGSGRNQMAAIRYLDNGTPDSLFGSGGKVALVPTALQNSEALGVAVDADGRIVLGGYFNTGTSELDRMAVARFTDSGQPDTTFGGFSGLALISPSPSDIERAHAVAIDAQGRIVLAGVTVSDNERDFGLARLNSVETADLAITKSSNVSSAVPGDTVTFTLGFSQLGPDTAELITVTDNLPDGLTFVSCSATALGACGGTGNDRTVVYQALGSGSNGAITLTATVDAGVADGTVLTNSASIASTTLDPVMGNNTSSTSIVIRNKADLLLTQRVAKLASRRLAFTLTVRNIGPYEARQVVLNNPMPNGTQFVGVEAGPWTCTALPPGSVGTLACTLPSLPSSGTTAATLTFDVKATAPGSVDITNTATVTAATNDPNLANNSATLVTRVSGK
jgi:uncharacterized delta-60 repeat protein/uncharacterized repeat protein (TIGR01451 family)